MIARSEFSEVIKDFVLILEKQLKGFSKENIASLFEILHSSRDVNLPLVFLGNEGKLMFRYPDSHEEVITEEKVMEILDYDEFKKSGVIALKKAS